MNIYQAKLKYFKDGKKITQDTFNSIAHERGNDFNKISIIPNCDILYKKIFIANVLRIEHYAWKNKTISKTRLKSS